MNDNQPVLRAETFVLLPHTVTDLDDFAAHHDRDLVSVDADPDGAARQWRERLARNPYGSDGFVALHYRGQELVAPDLWDDVHGTWYAVVEVVDAYLRTGAGLASFPGQPVDIELRGRGRGGVFRAGTRSTAVDPTELVPGLLDEAERFFTWVEQRVGGNESGVLARVRELRSRHQR